ncbi:MAG: HEAT repeat domain-containing protein [Planctomycetes bacterium]|jgi:HEAT repeat protein|nr:HEAT repeat domain-containing protein [Planctomycetota bacterium]
MLNLLLTTACSFASAPLPVWHAPLAATAPAATVVEEKAIRALDAWLKLYHSGKIDFRSTKDIRDDSLAEKFGLAPKNGLGTPTWAGDLEVILDAVTKLDSAEAARAVLDVAAIGIDLGKYTLEMAPYEVRAIGEKWAERLTTGPARDELAKAARGELKVEKARATAVQAAAVRCLGLLKDGNYRKTLDQVLGDADEVVRIRACEALGELGNDDSALALVALLQRETADAVLISAAQALRKLYGPHLPKAASVFEPSKDGGKSAPAGGDDKGEPSTPPPAPTPAAAALPESVRLAVRAAIGAIGKATWRADMALVRLLDEFRSAEAIPALIGVLERFQAHPEEVKSGKLSGLLLYQTHELLVAMTGAVHPADQPEKWRAFWDTEKDKIAVTQRREPAAGAGATVSGGFCGIPVQGTRVVFVLDLSGSMDWPMEETGTDGKRKRSIRLDFAKRELHRAIDAIAPNAQFNLITFNGDNKAEVWNKDLVPANERNRDRFKKYVDGLKALGGTNLWSGLEEALKIKSQVLGNRYGTNVDELFVLSDGAPTVGDVQDPIEILRLVQECNRFANVRINTLFISSAAPPEQRQMEAQMKIKPQELMRRMAEQNGGKFKEL